jgi:hypothetical protein
MRARLNEIWQNLKWRIQHAFCHLDRMSVECGNLSDNVWTRETREGWPLLSATEMNVDSKSANEGVLPWLCWRACRAGKRDFCSALAVLVGPVQNIFFLAVHYFNSFVHIALQVGQAVVLGRLSLSMCLWCGQIGFTNATNVKFHVGLRVFSQHYKYYCTVQ